MAVMIGLVYLIVDHGFKASLLRASDDDLSAIRKAYATADPPARGVHEAVEMIEDRTLASDAQDQFLLQLSPARKVAGNMGVMAPKAGILYLHFPVAAGGAPAREILGRGEFIAPQLYAFVGRDLFEVRRSEREVLVTFAGVLAASVLLAGACGLWLSSRYLRGIDAISDTCRVIMTGDLRERVTARRRGGELARLAATVNGMLDRIQALMEALRQVSDDIAHDLRTPLTHLRHSLERAQTEAISPQDYERAIEQAIAEADQLLDMFAALLRIARIEGGAQREAFAPFDLGELLAQAFSMYRPLMEDTGHPASMTAQPGVVVNGDRQLVLHLITNLLDNTVHHTPEGAGVVGWAGLRDGAPALIIADTGPGVPGVDLERVLRRFYRLEKSRMTPGHGLGLSMASAIAQLHDAEISLSDNGPGLRVTIKFRGRATFEGRSSILAAHESAETKH